MEERVDRQVGAQVTITKDFSEADLALFMLVMGDAALTADEPLSPDRQQRQAAPGALLVALLASTAARHALRPQYARFVSAATQVLEPAYTDDTLTTTAELAALDGETMRVIAHCKNQDGRRLAEGEFLLSDS
ncbi:MAG TPA: hypothetical protein VMV29_13650 [Ktedonobacterales bacterium]|nr:hypothetical protein [Ktedonobacterales bacterium]